MLQRLADRVVIITGAASGIGQATAIRAASEGAKVLATDINPEGLEETLSAINSTVDGTGECITVTSDISNESEAASTVAAALDAWGRIDGLANIAGMLRSGRTHDFDLETWNRIIAVNLTGTFLMCRAALPHLIAAKGSIVNAASTSSFFGHPFMAAYAASKGAILSFTQAIAVEYCKVPVRANCVAPGSVHSGITSAVTYPDDLSPEEGKLIYRIMSPTGFGEPADVASVVVMLLSEDGRHITGECIRIDGGTHA